jgi:teichuronic acid biosynthesis glycosyltransferase TuaG
MKSSSDYPWVDVIVPIYNCEAFVSETIDSLLQQSYPNKKLILVNDCSTDSSWEIINSYSKLENLSIVNLNRNIGESGAINFGWSKSTSRFITVVSADDPQLSNWLTQMMIKILENPGFLFYYPDVRVIDENSKEISFIHPHPYAEELLVKKFICLPSAGTVIDKSELVEEFVPRLEGVVHPSDLIQWLRIAKFGKGLKIPLTLGTWRQHSSSLSYANTFQRSLLFRDGIYSWANVEGIKLDRTQRFYLLAHQFMIIRSLSVRQKIYFLLLNIKNLGVLFRFKSLGYVARYLLGNHR